MPLFARQISKLFGLSVVEMLTYKDPEDEQKYLSEMDLLTKKLDEKNTEVIDLQKKVIELYEGIRHVPQT